MEMCAVECAEIIATTLSEQLPVRLQTTIYTTTKASVASYGAAE